MIAFYDCFTVIMWTEKQRRLTGTLTGYRRSMLKKKRTVLVSHLYVCFQRLQRHSLSNQSKNWEDRQGKRILDQCLMKMWLGLILDWRKLGIVFRWSSLSWIRPYVHVIDNFNICLENMTVLLCSDVLDGKYFESVALQHLCWSLSDLHLLYHRDGQVK